MTLANKKPLILLGGGGHAHVVADAARLSGWEVLGYLAPEQSKDSPAPYLGTDKDLAGIAGDTKAAFSLAIGSVSPEHNRREIFGRLKSQNIQIATILHPSVLLASSSIVGAGCQIMAGVTIQPKSEIGENVIINTRASIDHHAIIGSHCHIAPGAVLCGHVTLGESCHIGPGAVILQKAVLPPETFVKANGYQN